MNESELKLLISLIDKTENSAIPKSITLFHCKKEQVIKRVPFYQSMILIILRGQKIIPLSPKIVASPGDVLFIPGDNELPIINQPDSEEYLSIGISCSQNDFLNHGFYEPSKTAPTAKRASELFLFAVRQYIELSMKAPEDVWGTRRIELLLILQKMGYFDHSLGNRYISIPAKASRLISSASDREITLSRLAQELRIETSFLEEEFEKEELKINDLVLDARMGQALGMVITSAESYEKIAKLCGFAAMKEFKQSFCDRYGVGPEILREAQKGSSRYVENA